MTTEQKLDRLTGIVETLAAGVVARDNEVEAHTRQIAALIDLATTRQEQIEAHDAQIGALLQLAEKHATATANLERQWQVYLNTLPRQ